jgi:hypothetical protein
MLWNKVVSNENYSFIYVGTADAYVIPRSSVTEGKYDAFVEAVTQHLAAAHEERAAINSGLPQDGAAE